MKAIDTHVLVRLQVNDNPVQGEQVRQLFAAAERLAQRASRCWQR